jgi:hypothetical protein
VLKLNYVQKNNAVVLLMQYILLQAATMMLWLACCMREHKTPIWKKITKFDSCEKKTLPNAKFLCMTENVRK